MVPLQPGEDTLPNEGLLNRGLFFELNEAKDELPDLILRIAAYDVGRPGTASEKSGKNEKKPTRSKY